MIFFYFFPGSHNFTLKLFRAKGSLKQQKKKSEKTFRNYKSEIRMKSCLDSCLHLPTVLELHLFLLWYKTCTAPHYHSFSIWSLLFIFKWYKRRFPTCILRKDRLYANPMIRRCKYLGRVSEVDATIASNSNSKAYVTCEWWILNEVVIGFINLLEHILN